MSERRRVFLGLQGRRFPREGQRGLYTRRVAGQRLYAEIEVLCVSSSGQTIWTRFISRQGQHYFGGPGVEHRWWRVPDSDLRRRSIDEPLYSAGVDARRAPTGDITFPDVIPAEAL